MLTVCVLILRGRRSWALPTLLGASAAEPLVQLLRCGQLHLCQGSGSVSCSLSSGSCWSATVGTVPPPTQALLFARPAVWASRRVRAFLRRLSSVLPPFCNKSERTLHPSTVAFLFPEGSGAGISTPSASADPLLAGAGTAASAVVGCSRERARAASSALADIAAGSRCYPRDVFAAARPLLLARKEERCVGARSRSTSVHSNNSLCSEIGRLVNPPS